MNENLNMPLEGIPTEQLYAAAAAWRRHGTRWNNDLPWWVPLPRLNLSLYDRIDELVDEIARLRSLPPQEDKL